jgi:hypothetical protein
MRHNGDRPYTCFVCAKRFMNQLNWRVHMRRHDGVRPFVCHLCRKAFVDKWSLTKHLRSHGGETAVSAVVTCRLCSKTYSDSGNLRRHMRTVHNLRGTAFGRQIASGTEEQGNKMEGEEEEVEMGKEEGEGDNKYPIWTILRDLGSNLSAQVPVVKV